MISHPFLFRQNDSDDEYDDLLNDDKELDAIRHINRTINSKLPVLESVRNVTWYPVSFEFAFRKDELKVSVKKKKKIFLKVFSLTCPIKNVLLDQCD